MSIFAVYQMPSSEAAMMPDIKAALMFNGSEALEKPIVRWAVEKSYKHVLDVSANDLNEVFEVGNVGPESQIVRWEKAHSISVGDVISYIDQGEVKFYMVDPIGFEEIEIEGKSLFPISSLSFGGQK